MAEPKPPADPRVDFDPKGLDIIPEADPNLDNSMRKKQRTGQLMEAKNAGMPLNEKHLARMFLESIEEPDAEQLLELQPPPPSDSQLKNEIEKDKLAFLREELAQVWRLRKHEPISDMAKAMKAFAEAQAIGNEAGMEELKMMSEQMMAQAKMAMDEQNHEQSMKHADKKIEVEDAKRETHAARTAATQQAARDKHVTANIDAADKHAAFEQSTADKHTAALQSAADRHAAAIKPKPSGDSK
jgi:membrane protein involved in colicin uptake